KADWVILPGSKHTSGDLSWLRARGLDHAVLAHASRGKPLLGICGGLQMLGTSLRDPHRVDGEAQGLNLLPLVTQFEKTKTVRHRQTRFGSLSGFWKSLSGLSVRGYEIHQGHTRRSPIKSARAVLPDNLAWQNKKGNVLGLYMHGLFEDP